MSLRRPAPPLVSCLLSRSPEQAVGWMESLCRAFPTNPKEAEAALTELRRSEHAVEVSKIILGACARDRSSGRAREEHICVYSLRGWTVVTAADPPTLY